MLTRLFSSSILVLAMAGGAVAQTNAPSTSTPGVTVVAPNANAGTTAVTPPPGVADPITTNSTTGTVDQEDHCQAPGTQANSNPSAEVPSMPRPEQACR